MVLLRDQPGGFETYVLVRNMALEFAPGATVFPGGAVDPDDHGTSWAEASVGYSLADAAAHLNDQDGLAYWVAAARECFEEVGVLLGHAPVDRAVSFADHVAAGRIPVLRDMWYFGHWITPIGAPRRYDTRFFLSIVDPDCRPDPDRGELISGRWLRPAQALAEFEAGEIDLIDPTMRTLQFLAQVRDSNHLRSLYAGSERLARPMIPQGRAGERVRFALDESAD